MTNRYERLKMQRRMQRRIRLVVEERRIAFGAGPRQAGPVTDIPVTDIEETVEIPAGAVPVRAIGRMPVHTA